MAVKEVPSHVSSQAKYFSHYIAVHNWTLSWTIVPFCHSRHLRTYIWREVVKDAGKPLENKKMNRWNPCASVLCMKPVTAWATMDSIAPQPRFIQITSTDVRFWWAATAILSAFHFDPTTLVRFAATIPRTTNIFTHCRTLSKFYKFSLVKSQAVSYRAYHKWRFLAHSWSSSRHRIWLTGTPQTCSISCTVNHAVSYICFSWTLLPVFIRSSLNREAVKSTKRLTPRDYLFVVTLI